MRIFVLLVSVMMILFAGSMVVAKQEAVFKTSAMFDENEGVFIFMAQNNDNANQRGCGRGKRPPLSS